MGELLIQSPVLSAVPGLVHGFTRAEFEGHRVDMGSGATESDWDRLCQSLGCSDGELVTLTQVHGCRVRTVSASGLAGEGDALITSQKDLILAIRTADCVPILVVGEGGQIAAIHAGWRGVANGVVSETLSEMDHPFVAAIGPCISGSAYEVGAEVIDAIVGSGVPEEVVVCPGDWPRPHADLAAAVKWQLNHGGVDRVDVLNVCTYKSNGLHSFRRDGAASGRMAAVVGWSG